MPLLRRRNISGWLALGLCVLSCGDPSAVPAFSSDEHRVVEALTQHLQAGRQGPVVLSDSTFSGLQREGEIETWHFYYPAMWRDSLNALGVDWVDQNVNRSALHLKGAEFDVDAVRIVRPDTLPEMFFEDDWAYVRVSRVGFNAVRDSALIGYDIFHDLRCTSQIQIALMRREENGWVYDSPYDSLFWDFLR